MTRFKGCGQIEQLFQAEEYTSTFCSHAPLLSDIFAVNQVSCVVVALSVTSPD